ncbi:MAG: response regulator [Bacteroidales bacterium]|nr:response regulator transcription factor [Bacteroidales bacterium]MBS3775978.1 response regulator transcription factor [Bacteroidales bacterium]
MNEPFRIIIICEDLVLNALLKKAFKLWIESASVVFYNSFSEVKSISPDITIDLIILDDFITGSASHEILHILRQRKKIKCPVYYLSNAEYGEEKKALYQGANYFFKKPFDPEQLMKHITEKTKAKPLA